MRTIRGMEEHLDPLDSIINDQFLPALLGATITEQERQLCKLPVKAGGLVFSINGGMSRENMYIINVWNKKLQLRRTKDRTK